MLIVLRLVETGSIDQLRSIWPCEVVEMVARGVSTAPARSKWLRKAFRLRLCGRNSRSSKLNFATSETLAAALLNLDSFGRNARARRFDCACAVGIPRSSARVRSVRERTSQASLGNIVIDIKVNRQVSSSSSSSGQARPAPHPPYPDWEFLSLFWTVCNIL